MVTSLRAREKSVNLDQLSPIPITLIFKLTEKSLERFAVASQRRRTPVRAPSSVTNRPSQLTVTNARARLEVASSDACPLCGLLSNCQVLNSNQAVFPNQVRCQLMEKIGTGIFYLGVYRSNFKSCFISVIRAFGFPTQFLHADKSFVRCFKLLIQP